MNNNPMPKFKAYQMPKFKIGDTVVFVLWDDEEPAFISDKVREIYLTENSVVYTIGYHRLIEGSVCGTPEEAKDNAIRQIREQTERKIDNLLSKFQKLTN